jgi:hypothetical protein
MMAMIAIPLACKSASPPKFADYYFPSEVNPAVITMEQRSFLTSLMFYLQADRLNQEREESKTKL